MTIESEQAVEVVHWNPVRPVFDGRLGRRLPISRPVANFGDLIGPLLVERIRQQWGLERAVRDARLLTVGSILHFAQPGDVVWGSGVNGKVPLLTNPALFDVRAVRGPRTRERLIAGGASVPATYGDPALLWPQFWSRDGYVARAQWRHGGVTVVPNLHDWPRFRFDRRAVNPRRPVHEVIGRIATSDLVVGSSLHGVVLAEAMGIPARFMVAGSEPSFKYEDYLHGTGRARFRPGDSVREAIALGGQPAPEFDRDALLAAFPRELWAHTSGN